VPPGRETHSFKSGEERVSGTAWQERATFRARSAGLTASKWRSKCWLGRYGGTLTMLFAERVPDIEAEEDKELLESGKPRFRRL
jgi:hypothetical protein